MTSKDPYIQALRGLAIAAVVLVHCLPESPVSVCVRPFLNWAVALFLFLSGMLTGRRKVLTGEVLRGRIARVLGPYVVWSLIYLASSCPGSVREVVMALLTGGAAAHLYYLLVYIQLAVLTPLLMRALRSHREALYLVTPCVLVVWELRALCGVDAPSIAVLFPVWLVYYLFGLEWERWRVWLQNREGAVAAVSCVALALQAGEGFLWDALGDYGMATTQLRLANVVSSLGVISLLMLASESVKERLARAGRSCVLGTFRLASTSATSHSSRSCGRRLRSSGSKARYRLTRCGRSCLGCPYFSSSHSSACCRIGCGRWYFAVGADSPLRCSFHRGGATLSTCPAETRRAARAGSGLRGLREWNLPGVRCVTSDACGGIVRGIAWFEAQCTIPLFSGVQ